MHFGDEQQSRVQVCRFNSQQHSSTLYCDEQEDWCQSTPVKNPLNKHIPIIVIHILGHNCFRASLTCTIRCSCGNTCLLETKMMAQLNPANEALWKTQLATKGYATCTNPACRCVVKLFLILLPSSNFSGYVSSHWLE